VIVSISTIMQAQWRDFVEEGMPAPWE